MGIECLRQSGADEPRIRDLHKMLLEWQEKATHEMSSFSEGLDFSKIAETLRKHIRGLSLHDAIFSMALEHSTANLQALRKEVMENMGKYPLTHLFASSLVSEDGRTLAHKPSAFTNDELIRNQAIEIEMIQNLAQFVFPLRADAYINVCRREIWEMYHPRYEDLQYLVLHNPIVPKGHESFFIKGIVAGFRGDFEIAAHLLVPQIEQSIRSGFISI